MQVATLSAGANKKHYDFFERWLQPLPKLVGRFEDFFGEGRMHPFDNTEVAAVSLLSSSATLAGFLSLVEYRTRKRNGDQWTENGRADLWILDQALDESYSFEFKRSDNPRNPRLGVNHWLERAVCDVSKLESDESDHSFGGVITFSSEQLTIYDFELPSTDFAFCVAGGGSPYTYLFFRNYRKT